LGFGCILATLRAVFGPGVFDLDALLTDSPAGRSTLAAAVLEARRRVERFACRFDGTNDPPGVIEDAGIMNRRHNAAGIQTNACSACIAETVPTGRDIPLANHVGGGPSSACTSANHGAV